MVAKDNSIIANHAYEYEAGPRTIKRTNHANARKNKLNDSKTINLLLRYRSELHALFKRFVGASAFFDCKSMHVLS